MGDYIRTTKSVDEYIKEHEQFVSNTTLEQAREIVSKSYAHTNMKNEYEKAISMLIACSYEVSNQHINSVMYKDRTEQRQITETMHSLLSPLAQHLDEDTKRIVARALEILRGIDFENNEEQA